RVTGRLVMSGELAVEIGVVRMDVDGARQGLRSARMIADRSLQRRQLAVRVQVAAGDRNVLCQQLSRRCRVPLLQPHPREQTTRRVRAGIVREQRDRFLETARGRVEVTVLKGRSEEHTSELQSRENLVCRLLLEKKKKNTRCKWRAE